MICILTQKFLHVISPHGRASFQTKIATIGQDMDGMKKTMDLYIELEQGITYDCLKTLS
jgi:hypothetical protein